MFNRETLNMKTNTIRHLQMQRGSSAKGNNPYYEINLSADYSYTWKGIAGVKRGDGSVFYLDKIAIDEINTLAENLLNGQKKRNFRVEETDRSWVTLRIEFENGLLFESFENHGDYLPYTQNPPFESWVGEDIRIQGADINQKEQIIKLLQFEMELDRIFGVERVIK